MLVRLRIGLGTAALALIFPARASTEKPGHEGLSAHQIVDTISTIFNAIRIEDVEKFDSAIAPDFYTFDGGPIQRKSPDGPHQGTICRG